VHRPLITQTPEHLQWWTIGEQRDVGQIRGELAARLYPDILEPAGRGG
jgi:hypothetical protein